MEAEIDNGTGAEEDGGQRAGVRTCLNCMQLAFKLLMIYRTRTGGLVSILGEARLYITLLRSMKRH